MDLFLWWLAQNAVVVAAAIPLLWILCRWRAFRPAEQHLLWLVLLLKLVTPPVGQWPISVEDARHALMPAASMTKEVTQGQVLPDLESVEAEVPALLSIEPETTLVAPIIQADSVPPAEALSVSTILFFLWLGGSAAVLAVHLGRLGRQRRLLRRCTPASTGLQARVDRAAEQMGVRPIRVQLSSEVGTPCISCLGRTRLLWPAGFADDLPETEAIVRHELAHLRRRDHWVSWLELGVLGVCWWNPVAWLIRSKLHESREMACDALSLEANATDRGRYAELLLQLSSQMSPRVFAPAPLGAGFGVVAHQSLKRRLQMIFQERVTGRTSRFGIAMAVALGVATLPGWAWSQSPPEAKDPTATPGSSDVTPPAAGAVVEPQKADPNATPQPARSVASELLLQAVAKPSVVRQEPGGDVVQEIPVKGTVSKIFVRRSAAGSLIIEFEDESGTRHQTHLAIAPAGAGPDPRALPPGNQPGKHTVLRYEDGRIVAVEVESGKTRWETTLPTSPKKTATVTEDGKVLVVKDADGTVRTLDATTGKILRVEQHAEARATTVRPAPVPQNVPTYKSTVEGYLAGEARAVRERAASAEDIELAEINLQEKQLELEAAREDAAASNDSRSQRKVKLAELAVRRAEIELARVKAAVTATTRR